MNTCDHRARLYEFSTALIRTYVGAISVRRPTTSNPRFVAIEPTAQHQVEILKQFIWEYVILNRDLALPQQGQRKAIRTVFRRLRTGDHYMFPPAAICRLRDPKVSDRDRVRIVADFVSGMTEQELIRVYHELEAAPGA